MKRPILLLIFTTLFLTSCQKKVDGSSDEAMKDSVEEIKKSLDDDKKEDFEEAIQLIAFNELDFGKLMKEGGEDETLSNIKSKLDGKTANEIIKEGNKIKEKQEQKKREQAMGEIKELYIRKNNAEKDKQMLERFEIKRSRFYMREGYISDQPIIELTVKNGTDIAVSRAYFTGTLASPGRSIPWVKEDFNYEISGGLEPSEEVTWSLAPNSYGEWGDVDVPNDAILTVEVKKLDGPDGEAVYTVDNFGEREQDRLDELLNDYPEFAK